jgi:hypothetical protein
MMNENLDICVDGRYFRRYDPLNAMSLIFQAKRVDGQINGGGWDGI